MLSPALLRDLLRPAAGGGLYVRWSRAPDRLALLAIYDALTAAGVRVHPPRDDGLTAYDHLRARAASKMPGGEEEPVEDGHHKRSRPEGGGGNPSTEIGRAHV